MARTIRNSARDPHKRNSVKRDVIGSERRQSKRSDWKDLRTVTGVCDDSPLGDGMSWGDVMAGEIY